MTLPPVVFKSMRNHESMPLGGRLSSKTTNSLRMEWLLYPDVLDGCPDRTRWHYGNNPLSDLHAEVGPCSIDLTSADRGARITHKATGQTLSLRVDCISRDGAGARVWIEADPATRFYALGEQFASLEHTGRRIVCESADWWNKAFIDPPGWKHSYIPQPFLVTSAGYGVLIHATCRVAFDLTGAGRMGGRGGYAIEIEAAGIDMTIIYGRTPLEQIQEFVRQTGLPWCPPRWALEPLLATCSNHKERCWDAEIQRQYMEAFKKFDVPNGLVLDETWLWHRAQADSPTGHYMHYECYGDFEPQNFPDPAAAIEVTRRELHSRTIFIIGPFMGCNTKWLPMLKERGWLVRRASNPELFIMGQYNHYFFDFTNPEAVAWWKEELGKIVDLGIHGFFCDFAESDEQMDALYLRGGTGRNFGQQYNMLYKQAVREVIEAKRGDDFYMIGRAGWLGLQSLCGILQGDPEATYDGMRVALVGLLSNSMTGQGVIAHNIGGYAGEQSSTIYLRWVAFGVFSPLFAIWTSGESGGEPWKFKEPGIVDNYIALVRWRMRLLPYIYSAMKTYQAELVPTVRPLPLEFPGDARAAAVEDQFMIGSEILVAPVMNDEGHRAVYLPEGQWRDFWSGAAIAQAGMHETHSPLDRIPAFVREGGLVPLEANYKYGEDLTEEPLEINVYGTPTGRRLMLADGGRRIALEARVKGAAWLLSHEAIDRRKVIWKLRGVGAQPAKVTINGRGLDGGDWAFDGDGASLSLFLGGEAATITVEF